MGVLRRKSHFSLHWRLFTTLQGSVAKISYRLKLQRKYWYQYNIISFRGCLGKNHSKTIDCSLVTVYMTTVSLSVVVQRLWCILYSNKEKFINKSINDQVCHCSWYRWMFRHGSLFLTGNKLEIWISLPADLSGDFSCFESPTARFLCKFKVIQYLAAESRMILCCYN